MTMERRLLHRLRLVERWLDRTVTGGLAKAFPSPVDVIELESALRAECDARVASLSGGREVAPNEYAVTLAPEELRTEDESALVERLTAMLNEHVRSKGYSLAAPVAIRVSRDDAAVMGVPRIRSAILAHQLHEESPSIVYLTVGTRRIGLPEGIFRIGRDDAMDLRLEDVGVSRHHCDISRSNGAVTIHDRASTNGTIVNGVRVTKGELHHRDVITIGATEIIVEVSA
jgi:hypothetical protein